jgi:hypothetical protein
MFTDHSPSQFCDNCNRSIGAVRITCLPCSADNVFHSIDLCSDCIDKNITGEDVQKEHLSSHPMLQVRMSGLISAETARQRQATRKLEKFNLTNLESALCHECGEKVHRPCWLCIDCEGNVMIVFNKTIINGFPPVDTFICRTCNEGINRDSPWRNEHSKHSKNVHDWSHNLLNLALPPEMDPQVSPVDSIREEDQIARLEARLEQIQNHVNSLGRLDDSRIAATDTTNNRLSMIESRMSDLESSLTRLDFLDQKQQKLVESIGTDSQRLRRIEGLLVQLVPVLRSTDASRSNSDISD